jgi:hypothetical protein
VLALRPRTLLTAALAVAALVVPAAAEAAPASSEPFVWRVPVSSGAQIHQLERAGFDVVEPGADEAFVIGDDREARRLRQAGFQPS